MGNKPRIRFKGFTEDWEQRKLSDVADVRDGTHDSPKFYNDGFPLVTSKNLKDGSIDFSDCSFISEQDFNEINKRSKVDLGDILFGMIGTIGKPAIVEHTGFAIKNVALIKEGDIINNRFIYHLLSSKVFDDYIARENAGGTQKFIALNQIRNFIFSAPTLAEQNKIIELLDYISQTITLHQCKLEKLKLTKKALLQKLFPKNGKHIPEIRFKGFTDAWEQRKFSDITYLSGIKNKENKPYESYSISNEFGFIPQDEQFENGGTMKTADKSMYYIVSQNSFAYNPARINVGSIGYYDRPDNVIVSSLYEVFKTTDIVNDKFLWHWFKSNQFNRLIEKYQEGGVRLYFYYDKLCKGTIELPAIKEQNKISNLLDYLDIYITLHQRKLERLQEVRKGLLQKMFV